MIINRENLEKLDKEELIERFLSLYDEYKDLITKMES